MIAVTRELHLRAQDSYVDAGRSSWHDVNPSDMGEYFFGLTAFQWPTNVVSRSALEINNIRLEDDGHQDAKEESAV